jgi:arabinose-5-phosphate isomerase
MHAGDEVPSVSTSTPMRDAIYEMSRKRFGITAVVDAEERLVGVISDGDLRRLLERGDAVLEHAAGECMKAEPKTISPAELAPAALARMEELRITSLFVCAEGGALAGIVHLHDLWGLELF